MLIEKKPKIHITNKSILDLSVDTIVNSAAAEAKVGVPFHGKKTLDYMVYDAAGYKEMLAERKKIGYLKTGACCTTSAYKLSERGIQRVIHVNVPRNDIKYNEIESLVMLSNCYFAVLSEAKKYGSTSIAIPLLGTGNKNFDEIVAIRSMRNGTEQFLMRYPEYPIDITISIISDDAFKIAQILFTSCEDPSQHYAVPEFSYDEAKEKGYFSGRGKKSLIDEETVYKNLYDKKTILDAAEKAFDELLGIENTVTGSIEHWEDNPLLKKVREHNLKTNYTQRELADRSMLSKDQIKAIYMNKRIDNRNTIIGLCFGFCLSLKESVELMQAAGFSFRGERGDIIILEGIKRMEEAMNKSNGKNLILGRVNEIEADVNDKLLDENIDYVFVGNKNLYKDLIS